MEDSLNHMEKYFKYVSDHWSDIFNRNTSLSVPQVQTILLKDWQKLTNPTNSQESKKSIKDTQQTHESELRTRKIGALMSLGTISLSPVEHI